MLLLSQPRDRRSGVSHTERPSIYTLWTRDLSQVSHSVRANLTMRADVLTTHETEGLGEQSMTIQEAMHNAIEGGYHLHDSDGMGIDDGGANRECSAWRSNENDSTWGVGVTAPWLDPH